MAVSAFTTADQALPSRLEEITISARRVAMPINEVASSVSVLTENDINNLVSSDLAELLRFVPGVHVSGQGGLGKLSTVRIRGEAAQYTQLYLDGINLADTSAPQVIPRFDLIQSGNIERIEVLRGSQGLVYGAGPGGVISLYSKSASQPFEADVKTEMDSYDYKLISADLRGKTNSINYSLSASDQSAEGFNARISDALADKDGVDNLTVHGKFKWEINSKHSVNIVHRFVDARNEYDNCDWPRSDNCVSDAKSYASKLEYDYSTQNSWQKVTYTESQLEQKDESESTNVGHKEGTVKLIRYQGGVKANSWLTTVWGADHKTEYYRDFNPRWGDRRERSEFALFSEWLVSYQLFNLQTGLRHTDHEDYGDNLSYQLGLVQGFKLNKNLFNAKFNYGTGFRAPSLYEANNVEIPRALLEEEKSETAELGVEWIRRRNKLSIVAFKSQIENRIDWMTQGYIQIPGMTESRGYELELDIALSQNWLWFTNFTYNKTNIDESANPQNARLRAPKYILSAGLEASLFQEKLALNIYGRAVRDVYDAYYNEQTFATERVAMDDYEVASLTTRYNLLDNTQVFLKVDNIFDQEYQEVYDYSTAGRTATLGVEYSFH